MTTSLVVILLLNFRLLPFYFRLPSVLPNLGGRGEPAADRAGADAGAFLDRVVGRNLEERGVGLAALYVGQAVGRLAEARVAVARHDDDLKLGRVPRSEEHTSELQSRQYLVCRLLLE